METITILKIVFTALLCIPVLWVSFRLVGKLVDELTKKPRNQG